MTAERFMQMKAGSPAVSAKEQEDFKRTLAWEKRSNAAKLAVRTKRSRYKSWPTRKNDHK
jgi:hypothetical protein